MNLVCLYYKMVFKSKMEVGWFTWVATIIFVLRLDTQFLFIHLFLRHAVAQAGLAIEAMLQSQPLEFCGYRHESTTPLFRTVV